MRNAFADEITRLGIADHRVVLLSGDIGNKLFDRFRGSCPDRFFNCGIAEANMMGVAAGLGLSGLRPVIYTIAPFTTTRCLEQIRVDACYNGAPVVFVGTGAGLAYGELGATHHSCEDIAVLRALPGMTIFCPCDPEELRRGLRQALNRDGPVYIRLGKKGEPALHRTPPEVILGQAITLRPGTDVCLIGTGTVLAEALTAAESLAAQGISARVEDFHTVKPLDLPRLAEIFGNFDLVVTIEEHSRIGGLFGAVAEVLAGHPPSATRRLLPVAVEDRFLHEVHSQDSARRLFGLTAAHIVDLVRDARSAGSR